MDKLDHEQIQIGTISGSQYARTSFTPLNVLLAEISQCRDYKLRK